MDSARPTIRIDKWLWYARFFKTRSLAAKLVTGGHVRVNSTRVSKASAAVGPGDVLTFPQGSRIRVVELVETGTRRGPAPEAQTLYTDLSPPPEPKLAEAQTVRGAPPSRKERRTAARLKSFDLE
ncbi:MAG: RNA-binding S4 domain-containing protein [Pseudomonadota bacterium]